MIDGFISADNVTALLVGVLLLVFPIFIALILGYYSYKFSKTENMKAKLFGRMYLIFASILIVLIMICGIAIIVIYQKATDSNNPIYSWGWTIKPGNLAFGLSITGVILLAVIVLLIILQLPKFGIGLTDDRIQFMGEAILYKNVVKVVQDKETKMIFIFFRQGKRTIKRQRYNPKNVYGQFILQNVELMGQKLEVTDANEYFKSLVK